MRRMLLPFLFKLLSVPLWNASTSNEKIEKEKKRQKDTNNTGDTRIEKKRKRKKSQRFSGFLVVENWSEAYQRKSTCIWAAQSKQSVLIHPLVLSQTASVSFWFLWFSLCLIAPLSLSLSILPLSPRSSLSQSFWFDVRQTRSRCCLCVLLLWLADWLAAFEKPYKRIYCVYVFILIYTRYTQECDRERAELRKGG